jgi:hypothetical protein
MSAIPEGTPDGQWDDDVWGEEWSPWDEMALLERHERGGRNWVSWVARLVIVALVLPLVLGALVALMIWIF